MSRAFDAKQYALSAYKDDKESAVEFFLGYLDISESDFMYEFNQSAEEYLFGSIEDA